MDGNRLKSAGEALGLLAFGAWILGFIVASVRHEEPSHALFAGLGAFAGSAFLIGGVGVIKTAEVTYRSPGGGMTLRGSAAKVTGVGFVFGGLAALLGGVTYASGALRSQGFAMSVGGAIFAGLGIVITFGLVPTYVKNAREQGGVLLALFVAIMFGGFGVAALVSGALMVVVGLRI